MTGQPRQAPSCCVLIPCLDEAATIGEVVRSVLALGLPVIVIDDGSDDDTAAIVAALPVTLIRHGRRRGKGEALRSGFRKALELGFDAAVTMDGDGQHIAADVPRLIEAAARLPGHIVTAARVLHRERQPGYRRRANDFADWGISWAVGQRLVDSQSGQRYYPRAALELADIDADGFVFETEILIAAATQRGLRIASIPIESRYKGEFRLSHFRPLRDFTRITVHVVWRILRGGLLLEHLRRVRHERPLLVDAPPALSDPIRAGTV